MSSPSPASATPILDRAAPPPALKSQRKHTMLGVVIGATIGIAFTTFGFGDSPGPELPPWGFPLLFLLFWQLTVAVHEGAHILAGSLTGFSCRGFMVCCYRVVRTIRGWRFGFEWKRIFSGGFAYVMPVRLDLKDWQYGAMIAAGPVSNLLVLALFLMAPWPAWAAGARPPALLAAGLITAISLLPITAGAMVSDMARLVALARGGSDWQRWKLVLRFQTLNVQGVAPREWDALALNAAASLPGGRTADRLVANLLAYVAAIDRGEFAEAARFLETTLEISDRVGAMTRGMLFLEAAFFHARRRGDACGARAWLTQAGSAKGVPKYCVAGAESGVLFAEGDFAGAAKKAATALAQLKRRAPDVATVQLAARSQQEILDEVESAAAIVKSL